MSGSLTVFLADPSDVDGGTAETYDFRGVASGDGFTLNFPSNPDLRGVSGRVEGSTLLLTMPGSAGTRDQVPLDVATEADYNGAVGRFADQARAALASAAEKEQAAASLETALRRADELGKPMDRFDLRTATDIRIGTLTSVVQEMRNNLADDLPLGDLSPMFFDIDFGISYRTYFGCDDGSETSADLYSSTGTLAHAMQAVLAEQETVARQIEAAADTLERVIAEDPLAEVPATSVEAARATAARLRAAGNIFEGAWQAEVREANELRDEATQILAGAQGMLSGADQIDIDRQRPKCTLVPWDG